MNLNTMTMNVNEMNMMMTTEDMMMCGAYNNAVLPSPYFVKENHAGVVRTSCQDELFRERIIHLCGPVDMAQAYVIIDQLKCLEKENPLERIVMRISSGGGEVSAGLAIYDAMREVSCPIETVCEGMAASMAAVLFCAGTCRTMMPNAQLMIHDPILPRTGGNAMAIQTTADRIMELRMKMAQILATHTGKSLESILNMTCRDYYMSATEAVKCGFADRVKEPMKPIHIPNDLEKEMARLECNRSVTASDFEKQTGAQVQSEAKRAD